ncbi:hypothetical protein XENTR_v10000710 [Xenopus tropicalis]|nr:hypothetical protein XENTR_v10000710 [Xenopus tropicalis]
MNIVRVFDHCSVWSTTDINNMEAENLTAAGLKWFAQSFLSTAAVLFDHIVINDRESIKLFFKHLVRDKGEPKRFNGHGFVYF